MARKLVRGSRWSTSSWRAIGVVAGGHLSGAAARGQLIHEQDGEAHYLWGGLEVDLFRDAAETYWENLTGENPALFIVCHEADDGNLRPVAVTADQHQAIAGTEGNERVFAAPIPPEVYREIERFVIEYHAPKPVRKRKRKNWSAESEP